ncbi:SCP2 sterol-binding domain-containing protein [Pseudoalteromonas sp. MM17-2]|uniref:ubiquinone biosynthesis accessory factor UbiJ n=1 Tax=Pseudoalteromonas sp. MM17-2 TaxID=2917753 RepID=UPI001EF67660|nr:SCP2 sterol-binding domain-containing protein [Pseudoalteromonas sp. MM17-2]MCG7545220.1 SCP2 sterol-binding domain-containing protein [Pseudoalteromonas sp. MM17-2]
MLSHFAVAGAEKLANRLILLDPQLQQRLQQINTQVLVLHIRDWQQYVSVHYGDAGLMLQAHKEAPEQHQCFISADTDTLMKLKDPSLLTQLIRQDKLDLEGDIHLAQAYSQAFNDLDIDWPEHWSKYIGDAPAQLLWQTLSKGKAQAQQSLTKLDHIVPTLLQDELKVSIHPLELEQFTRQSRQLKSDVQHLEQRIDALLTHVQQTQ